MSTLANKEFLYNFKSGGWNSTIAKTKRGAVSQAKKRWAKESPKLVELVDEKSFRIKTESEYRLLLSLFD